MESSNKFGLYNPKLFKVKKSPINQSNHAFILIRSEMDDLILLAKLLKITHYLLKKSPLDMELTHDDTLLSFPVYVDNETLEEEDFYMIKNVIPGNTAYQYVGYGNNALFKIQQKKGDRKLPQLFLPLEEEMESLMTEEKHIDEMKRWEQMKNDLKKQSVSFSKRIDFVIPINIATYEAFSPFLLKLNQVSEIKLRLVEASEFENFESIFYHLELYTDMLKHEIQKEKDDKLQNLLDSK